MVKSTTFESIGIKLASPEAIRSWSRGEVKKTETINYRTQKPDLDGLFCEKIFGPQKDYECHCGKYKKIRYKGIICDKCGVEVTVSAVRRERMGHIELASPVLHSWYFRGGSSKVSLLLGISNKNIEQIVYLGAYVITNPKETDLKYGQVLSEQELEQVIEVYGEDSFEYGTGAEVIKVLLQNFDLEKERDTLKEKIAGMEGNKVEKVKLAKQLEIINDFIESGNKPEWMVLDVLPVLPPDLRPMPPLDGGYACSDLNELYKSVINRNNKLKSFLESGGTPKPIITSQKRMLQEAVDNLIDNGRRGKARTSNNGRELKCLTEMLKGKTGRFRQNLLGKRVDFSGRSVIVVGPELKMYQCGVPKEMALELFKPFVIQKLVEYAIAPTQKQARKMVERQKSEVWDILEEVIKDHPVLLNRAPTLHRLGIQAFEPVLVDGKAIKLHPLACTAFNADFDGDQMAIHIPLTIEAQAEARILMLSSNNILKLSDGKSIVTPTQDMILGSYYLTFENTPKPTEKEDIAKLRAFKDPAEAEMAYSCKQIKLQDWIRVKMTKVIDGVKYSKIIVTTVGKIIFNKAIPQDIGILKRNPSDPLSQLDLEVQDVVKKGLLGDIVTKCFKVKGATEVSKMLDVIKEQGYKFSTISGITTSVFDMKISPNKEEILTKAEKKVREITSSFEEGEISEDERYRNVVKIWDEATNKVSKDLEDNFKNVDKTNPIWMMADSGARGSMKQIQQLSGMRGLMADPTGKTIEIPVKSSFREGISALEYFISTHGSRKGGADTALKTADSGYLTRRLVDVSQDIVITEIDCGDKNGTVVRTLYDNAGEAKDKFKERINGRYTVRDILNPKTKEVIFPGDTLIRDDDAEMIDKVFTDAGISEDKKEVTIRSVLSCKCKKGICAKCYGANMASGNLVKIGEAVGIIAAQSIGEPGTQLTMRTFHTGGVATSEDITQGLPRITEIVEARNPKGAAEVAEVDGTVYVRDGENKVKIIDIVSSNTKDPKTFQHKVPIGKKLFVTDGQSIKAGDQLYQGNVHPKDILRTKGLSAVQEMIIREIQSTYRSNGVTINDKHIEIIVRKMLHHVRIIDPGDTKFIYNQIVDIDVMNEENDRILAAEGKPAKGQQEIRGIAKVAVDSKSFLSAASFQETAKVLTDAAIKGKVDHLEGIKENVIIGGFIPAGTGMKRYQDIKLETTTNEESNIVEDKSYVDNSLMDEMDSNNFDTTTPIGDEDI